MQKKCNICDRPYYSMNEDSVSIRGLCIECKSLINNSIMRIDDLIEERNRIQIQYTEAKIFLNWIAFVDKEPTKDGIYESLWSIYKNKTSKWHIGLITIKDLKIIEQSFEKKPSYWRYIEFPDHTKNN